MVAELAAGEIDIIIGTHALITKDTEFKSLGLAIIDEQHKCGAGPSRRRSACHMP